MLCPCHVHRRVSSLLQDFSPNERQSHNWNTGILATESLLISYAALFILIPSLFFTVFQIHTSFTVYTILILKKKIIICSYC